MITGSVGTRTLYLVRHGQQVPETGQEDRLGSGLTPLGVAQAEAVAARLVGNPLHAIHASTLRRAAETAAVIAAAAPGVPVHGSELLWEALPTVPDRAHPDERYRYQPTPDEQVRAAAAYDHYFRRAPYDVEEVIVAHGNLLRYFVCRALGAPPGRWANLAFYNAALTTIVVETDGQLTVVGHNDSGHLSPGQVTIR